MKSLCLISFLLVHAFSFSQYELKWTKQNISVTIPNTPENIAEDTINDIDYFEYVDENEGYDFGIDVIFKGDPGFKYYKDVYKYTLKAIKKEKDYEEDMFTFGKIPGLNSFYAIYLDEGTNPKTGGKYKSVLGEMLFYSEDKQKLFMMDIEFDNSSIQEVERILKSIKFYK